MKIEIILNLIMAISTYCGNVTNLQHAERTCFKQIWTCGYNVKDSSLIVIKTHNCMVSHAKSKGEQK